MRRVIMLVVLLVLVSLPVPGHAGTPVPRCFGKVATLVGSGDLAGTAANDVIVGSSGVDTIDGRGGNDLICVLGGDDTVQGGPGTTASTAAAATTS